MIVETESSAIIEKIDKQCKGIIEEIKNRQTSKNLSLIEIWIKQQINSKYIADNIQLLAILIDTIYQFFKKESDIDKTNLIEKCLTNLINNWNNFSPEKIQEIICQLKVYNKTDDTEAQAALKEFIDKSSESTNFLIGLSKKLVSSCEKYLDISTIIKSEFNNTPAAIELATDANLVPIPFFKAPSPELFGNNSTKKKIKTRIIEFDEDGVGYEFFYPYRCFLNDINLEVELPAKIKKKLLREKLRDELWREEFERLTRIEVNEKSWLTKLERKIKIAEFDLFASQEEKDARKRKIEQKIENTKKIRERRKKNALIILKIFPILKRIASYKKEVVSQSLSLDPFFIETPEHDFLTAYLKTINYEKFKELIDFSEYIVVTIEKIKETCNKIDVFSKSLGISSDYVFSLNAYSRRIKENFNKENISSFLENSLILFEQKTLILDNNYCLFNNTFVKNKINFSEPNFLDEFISVNNNQKIYKILSNEIKHFFSKRRDNIIPVRKNNLKLKMSLIKKFLSLFTEEYYLSNKKIKKKFIKLIFANFSEPISIEAMNATLNNLRWQQFFLLRVGIIFSLRKRFRMRLSEELFLDLVEEKFEKINQKQEYSAENIDKLYVIKNHINTLKNKIQDCSINLNSLNLLDSRQAIVDRLKSHKEIKHLLDNINCLSNQALNCINQLNDLKNACVRESEKILEENETSEFNKAAISKVHIPLKWMR